MQVLVKTQVRCVLPNSFTEGPEMKLQKRMRKGGRQQTTMRNEIGWWGITGSLVFLRQKICIRNGLD